MTRTWTPPALSVRQPWAWAILHAGKAVENRRWATDYRGELLIHAGKTVEDDAVDVVAAVAGRDVPEGLPTGGVVGRVRLVDVHHADDCYMTCSPAGWNPMMRIAITGHRGLPAETTRLIDRAIRDEIRNIGGESVVGIGCLVDGADQLFARAVLDADGGAGYLPDGASREEPAQALYLH